MVDATRIIDEPSSTTTLAAEARSQTHTLVAIGTLDLSLYVDDAAVLIGGLPSAMFL